MYKTHQRVDIIGKDETGGKGRDEGEELRRRSMLQEKNEEGKRWRKRLRGKKIM